MIIRTFYCEPVHEMVFLCDTPKPGCITLRKPVRLWGRRYGDNCEVMLTRRNLPELWGFASWTERAIAAMTEEPPEEWQMSLIVCPSFEEGRAPSDRWLERIYFVQLFGQVADLTAFRQRVEDLMMHVGETP